MKTLKVRLQGTDHPSIREDRRLQSSCTRTAYNDFAKRHLTQEESKEKCTAMYKPLKARLVDAGVRRGSWIWDSVKESRKQVAASRLAKQEKLKSRVKWLEEKAAKEGRKVNGMSVIRKRRKKAILRHNSRLLKEGRKPRPRRKKNKSISRLNPQFGKCELRSQGLITREEYKESRLMPLLLEGEKAEHGNRNAELDVEDMTLIYKRSKDEHIPLKIADDLSERELRELRRVKEAMDDRLMPVSFSIGNGEASITFDDSKLYKDEKKEERERDCLNPNRVMGIDLNPNYIGVAIIERLGGEEFRVLDKFVYDLTMLNSHHISNKRRHELIELNHRLMRLAKHFKVGTIAVERLKIASGDMGGGKGLNRLCNNDWNRNTIMRNLSVLCNRRGQNLVKVDPRYSSFIGNLFHGDETTPDMVAAAMELALRAPTENFSGRVLPAFNVSTVRLKSVMKYGSLWKELPWPNIRKWKDLYNKVKDSGLMYRVSLADTIPRGQRFYRKMLITKHFYL